MSHKKSKDSKNQTKNTKNEIKNEIINAIEALDLETLTSLKGKRASKDDPNKFDWTLTFWTVWRR